jgi:Putative serine esterase (DUF676)
MKIKLLIGCLFFVSILNGQNPTIEIKRSGSEKPYAQKMAEMIELLDKRKISTGILADKAYSIIEMDTFAKSSQKQIDLTSWKQLHRQLYIGSLDPNLLLSPDSLKAIADEYLNQDIFPIGLMNVKYNQFKKDFLNKKLLKITNGKFEENLDEPLYDEKKVFALSILKDKLYSGKVKFQIDDHLFITNAHDIITSIQMDFGDGAGFVNVFNKGEHKRTIVVNYSSTGTKNISAKVNYENGVSLVSNSTFSVMSISLVDPDDILFVRGISPFKGETGTGAAYILYGCGNKKKLRKPIIVSDPFDPENSRHFYGIYDTLNKHGFIERMIKDGYDFVILDYDGGADYIQKNAFVLISLIKMVNEQLDTNKSNAQLVVVGASMAGLISKYALSYMEQNNINHNTRLYVSFDSPHLGANIPLGAQHWIRFFAEDGDSGEAKDGKKALDTRAAQQMLVYHYSSFQSNPLRIELLNDPYLKLPSHCRNIAISNGAGNSNSMFFNPGEQIIEYDKDIFVAKVLGNAWAVPNGGPQVIGSFFLSKAFVFSSSEIVIANNTLPYDGAAGGAGNVLQTIANGNPPIGDIKTNHNNHCFIPTVSALALNAPINNFNVSTLPNYPYINNKSITPFDAIYAPSSNEQHVLVTPTNIEWLMNEIGNSNMFLQNNTISTPTDFESRNTIRVGENVTNSILQGRFVIQNTSGIVRITGGKLVRLEKGTLIKPSGTGKVIISVQPFLCQKK